MNKTIVMGIVGCLIIAGGSFYAGTKYAAGNKNMNGFTNLSPGARQARIDQLGFAGGQRGARGGSISGEIISKDDKSITVKLQDSGSKIIFLSESTPITRTVAGTLSDIAVGTTIIANGKTNIDGSINAQSIQIRTSLKTNQ